MSILVGRRKTEDGRWNYSVIDFGLQTSTSDLLDKIFIIQNDTSTFEIMLNFCLFGKNYLV
jgi:hypothetical protein